MKIKVVLIKSAGRLVKLYKVFDSKWTLTTDGSSYQLIQTTDKNSHDCLLHSCDVILTDAASAD